MLIASLVASLVANTAVAVPFSSQRSKAFLPLTMSEGGEAITPIMESMMEDMQTPVPPCHDRKVPQEGFDLSYAQASPNSRSQIAKVATALTDEVIQAVLSEGVGRGGNGFIRSGSPLSPKLPPALEKQSSNMSVVSVTSVESGLGARLSEGKEESGTPGSIKARERLEEALSYGGEMKAGEGGGGY